jgi:hypothetical protein
MTNGTVIVQGPVSELLRYTTPPGGYLTNRTPRINQ